MKTVTAQDLTQLYVPSPASHKGQNGRLMIIGGSHLFHAASIWALEVASRIVDLVHYSSVPENNEIVAEVKKQFRDGIIVPRSEIEAYIEEDDAVLIGPGMTRDKETEELTNSLLEKYPHKQWVIDAGALQMMDITHIPKGAILTPHHKEFELLWEKYHGNVLTEEAKVAQFASHFGCVVLLKGQKDTVSNGRETRVVEGGNAGMTKGGTGDVLAGLVAALACKNDPMLAATAASYINKKAGDALFQKAGVYFNASDLASQIPVVMKEL
jgi:NAD(P)H-hydrate epimerase